MDTLSHAIWGAIFFGRNGKKRYRGYIWAVFFGVLPDALPFTAFMLLLLSGEIGLATSPWELPEVVVSYRVGHSFVTAGAALAAILRFYRALFIPFLAWPLHIVMDIFTHTEDHVPTLFLYPLSDIHLSFVYWREEPLVVVVNYIAIALVIYFLLRIRGFPGRR